MIAQLSNIQQFFAAHMTDVLDWAKHVRPDPERKTAGDAAYVLIDSGLNRYKVSCLSSFVEPPAGAPYQCKALGTVTFDDFAGSKHIIAPKSDATWMEISKHIHVRELTDGLAIARRELAEATPETVGAVRVRVADLASRAQKWGVTVTGLPVAAVTPTTMQEIIDAPANSLSKFGIVDEAILSPENDRKMVSSEGLIRELRTVCDRPFIGAPILFITNPGESITGMAEIMGWCVNVHSDETISAFVTPDHSEPMYRDKLQRRNLAKGIRSNCWDFNERLMAPYRMAGEIDSAHKRADILAGLVEELTERGLRIEEKLEQLEKRIPSQSDAYAKQKEAREANATSVVKRGPGRPSNAEKAARAAAQAAEHPKDDEQAA